MHGSSTNKFRLPASSKGSGQAVLMLKQGKMEGNCQQFLGKSTSAFLSLAKSPNIKVQLFSGFLEYFTICMGPSELEMVRHSTLIQCIPPNFQKTEGTQECCFIFYFCSYTSSTDY